VGAVALNAILPLVLYPFAKTTWIALDVLLHRMDSIDRPSSGAGAASRPA